jgi:hypothetical protein
MLEVGAGYLPEFIRDEGSQFAGLRNHNRRDREVRDPIRKGTAK